MDGRRSLTFSSLDEVMPEVDRLLSGHRRVGNWTLGQICNHLAGALRCSVEGFPERAPWPVRMFIGPLAKRQVIAKGAMPTGVKIAEKFLPAPDLDDRAEAEALRATIRLFSAEAGPLAPHPMFGKLSLAEWNRFHCIHSAHHLAFVVPKAVAIGTRPPP